MSGEPVQRRTGVLHIYITTLDVGNAVKSKTILGRSNIEPTVELVEGLHGE